MKKRPMYRWYVEALGSHTNQVIAQKLSDETCAQQRLLCYDGVRRDLWLCDYAFIAQLRRSKSDLGIDFLIFNQRGNGAIRKWSLTKSRRAAAVMARRKLDAIRSRKQAS